MQKGKTIGVLGGMGPAATVEFFRRLVSATPARSDQEHLHVIIDSDPSVPDRTAAILGRGGDPTPVLVSMARRLKGAGAELLAIPCNTAHHYLSAIREAVAVPVLDMPAEAAGRVKVDRVGLIATDGTIVSGIYQRAFSARGIGFIIPEEADQSRVMRVVGAIKSGGDPAGFAPEVAAVVSRLGDAGATAVVAACTEISLLDGEKMPLPWIDALDALVEATIREGLKEDR